MSELNFVAGKRNREFIMEFAELLQRYDAKVEMCDAYDGYTERDFWISGPDLYFSGIEEFAITNNSFNV